MLQKNYCMNILLENATSYTEKSKIQMLTEAEQAVVNDRMIGNLYQSALKKGNIDFDNIPFSKGDIQKVDGYENMLATLDVLKGLSKKFGIKIPEVEVVENAIVNLRTYRNIFEKGFGLNIEFLKMYYNTLVYACIESTSLILSSYVEFTRTVNNVEFQIKKGKGIYGNICIDNLRKFNESIKSGSFVKFANGLINKDTDNFLGSVAGAAKGVMALAAIGAAIVPVVRELIYYFYESRMRVSEYLQQQKEFIEMNKFRLEASSIEAQKRNSILNKQKSVIDKLEKLSDKIKVNQQLSNKNAENKLKQDNKNWNLNTVSGNDDGFMFI